MLMNNAAKGLRRAIGNVDMNVIAPTINVTQQRDALQQGREHQGRQHRHPAAPRRS